MTIYIALIDIYSHCKPLSKPYALKGEELTLVSGVEEPMALKNSSGEMFYTNSANVKLKSK